MIIGKSQRAYKNLTPEARKNHFGKKKSPTWNSISNLSPKKIFKKKTFQPAGLQPIPTSGQHRTTRAETVAKCHIFPKPKKQKNKNTELQDWEITLLSLVRK
jgi:hypothetical protein